MSILKKSWIDPDTTTVDQLRQYIETFDELPKPSSHFLPGMLEGMNTITQRMLDLLPLERVRPIVTDAEQSVTRVIN